MINTTYTAPTSGCAGMPAFFDVMPDVKSYRVETAAGIGFGLVVSRGTSEDQVALGGAAPLGVAMRSSEYGNGADNDDKYAQYSSIPVARAGYLWVTVADTAAAGTVLNYNTTTGAIGAGAIGAGEGEAHLPGELVTASTAGGLAIIYFDTRVSSTAYLFSSQVLDTDYDAYTILAADTDNTPVALTVGASTFVGRKSTGGIVAMTPAQAKSELGTSAATSIDDNACCTIVDVAAQTDESEVSAALDGSSAKKFVPTHVLICVKSCSGTVAGDGTINIGTSTGGKQIASAQALTSLDTAGDGVWVALEPAAGALIAGNATLYVNVEKADTTATTLVLNVKIFGKQISIA